MRRRNFLLAGVGVVVAALGVRYWRARDEDAIITVLNKRLSYLKKDPAGMRQFVAEEVRTHAIASSRLHAVMFAGPFYTAPAFAGYGALARLIRHGEERIVSNYLLGSDFFVNGTNTDKVVHFRELYDPLRGCSNPFARTSLT